MKFPKSLFFAPIVLIIATSVSAQIIYPPGYVNMNVQSGGLVVPINNYLSKNEDQRESYVSNDWNQGSIVLLTGDTIQNYPLKYNLLTRNIEVKTERTVKVVPIGDVQQFNWLDNDQRLTFINGSGYTTGGTPAEGYYQVLTEGTLNLFKKHHLTVQKANYRPELDVGSTENRLVKTVKYFVATGKNLQELKNNKKIFDYFRQHRPAVKKFTKREGLNPKREDDLIAIVQYYNEQSRK